MAEKGYILDSVEVLKLQRFADTVRENLKLEREFKCENPLHDTLTHYLNDVEPLLERTRLAMKGAVIVAGDPLRVVSVGGQGQPTSER
jgi:hypothetical protein